MAKHHAHLIRVRDFVRHAVERVGGKMTRSGCMTRWMSSRLAMRRINNLLFLERRQTMQAFDVMVELLAAERLLPYGKIRALVAQRGEVRAAAMLLLLSD